MIDARVEVHRAIDGVGLAARELLQHRGGEVPMDLTAPGAGRIAFTTREPIGPVVAVSAFNHPINLIVHQVAPAVAVGCPVIVKPSEDTPLSARTFIEILAEAGLPPEWCAFFPCDVATAERLETDPRVGFFSFIGSARIGWMLRSKLAPDVRLSKEEIFGSVVAVYSYDDPDEAIRQANALSYAFQAAGFTRRLDFAPKLIRALDATAVMINDHTAFRVDWMPFAGRRLSGYGTGGIGYTMHDMSQDKMSVINL